MAANDNSISAALVIDTSISMSANGYVDITKIDSKAFINCGRPGDHIAVCNYDSSGQTPYPIKEVTSANSVLTDATNVVQNLPFNGNCTNIGSGLEQGINQLKSQTDSRGLVLLSDGKQNCGTNPLSVPPTAYPVFACAMGPNSDQGKMQQIAARSTNGQFYYAPKVVDMMKIYNQIRALNPKTQGIANSLKRIAPDYYELVPAIVSQGNSEAQFVVAWTNTTLKYTSGNPSSTQLSITLVDPNSNTTSHKPNHIGSGYIIFNVEHPLVGTWQVQVLYGTASVELPVTVGVFEFQHDASNLLTMSVEAPDVITKGDPINLKTLVTHNGENVPILSVSAEVIRPKISTKNALKLYKDEYDHLQMPKDGSKNMPEDLAKLSVLHQQRLPEVDILPHITSYHHFNSKNDNRSISGTITDTNEAGSYNININVKGTSHLNDSPFQRNHLLTVLVK